MKNKKELPEQIFDWLADKKYADLSAEEKALVDQYLTAEEYDAYAGLITDFQFTDRQLETGLPAPDFEPQPQPLWKKVLTYKIPLYQAAAAFVIFGVFSMALSSWNGQSTSFQLEERAAVDQDTMGTSLAEDDYPEELVFDY